jgi:hypothetical protein
MKHLIKLLIVSTLFFVSHSCKKNSDETNPYGNGNGQYTIWTSSDLGVGNIYVKMDNQPVGTISHFHTGGVTCGSGDVNVKASAGNHSYSATSDGGATWSGNMLFVEKMCNTVELVRATPQLAGNPGNPRFNLQFTNEQNVDLDLYVVTPTGNTIYYANTQADNGRLDVDCKCSSCPNGPNENIYWVNGTAPHGTYQVHVKYYGKCGTSYQASNFTLRILNQSTILQTITGVLSTLNQTSSTYSFNY